MGFTPQQVNEMSLWQFKATVNGYAEAHSPEKNEGLDQQDIEELSELIDSQ